MADSRVILFLHDFAGDLWSFSRDQHVWLVQSKANDVAARAVWDREAGYSSMHGVTTFVSSGDRVADLLDFLGTIDQHHPDWSAIHVRGVGADEVAASCIATELPGIDVRIAAEPDGFVITRDEARS